MIDFIIVLLSCFIIYKAAQMGFLIGLAAFLAVMCFIIYRKYSLLCIMVAMRCYTNGKKVKALSWFERAYKHKMTAQQKVSYAYYLLREGKTERAEQIYNGMLAFGGIPEEEKKYIKSNQAILYIKTGRLKEGLEILEELFPVYKNTSVYGTLGYAYILNGDIKKAEEFCLEAYDFNKENAIILDNLIQVYLVKRNFEKAAEYADELLKKQPTFVEGYYDIAKAYMETGKKEEAKDALNKALTIETSYLSNVSHEMVKELLAEIN